MDIEKSIYSAINGQNCKFFLLFSPTFIVCFLISGQKGSGKDFTLSGGVVSSSTAKNESDLKSKWREPGLIRLVFETVLGNIVAVSIINCLTIILESRCLVYDSDELWLDLE